MTRAGIRSAILGMAAFLAALADPASGTLLMSHLPDETAALAVVESNGGAVRATAETRIGRAGDWELGLRRHPSILSDGTLAQTDFDAWPNGLPVAFSMTYDGQATVTTTLRFGTAAASVSNLAAHDVAGDFNEIFIGTRALNAGSSIVVGGLFLDGLPVVDVSSSINVLGEDRDVLRIHGAGLSDGFTLTGTVTMLWLGAKPTASRLAAQVWLAKVVAGDGPPPEVTITSPAEDARLSTRELRVTAAFAAAGSAIDPASARLILDGVDRTAEAQATAAGLTFTPSSQLPEGAHTAVVTVRDLAGNEGRSEVHFTTDSLGPAIVITAPGRQVTGEPRPAISATFSDPSGVDLDSLYVTASGLSYPSDCTVGASSVTCRPSEPLKEAIYMVTVVLRDGLGNESETFTTFSLVLDLAPPVLALSLPVDGSYVRDPAAVVSGTVTDDIGVVSVRVNGDLVAPQGGAFQLPVTLREGSNFFYVSAADDSGSEASAQASVTLDTQPPTLAMENSRVGQRFNQAFVRVAGQAADNLGYVTLEINGVPVPVEHGRFQADVPLLEGDNVLTVRATDRAGNVAEVSGSVERISLPRVSIASPADLGFLSATTVDVSGSVSGAPVSVTVNGVAAALSGTGFVAREVPLIEGGNILTAVATDAAGHMGTYSINVVRDLTPPRLAVRHPAPGSAVFEATVRVSGLVNDIVAGTVNAGQAAVTVNGRPAAVANRSFLVEDVPLAPGDNVLTVRAVDESGNTGEIQVAVRREEPAVPRLAVVAGDGQRAVIGQPLPAPLVVAVLDGAGQPVAGRTVVFKVRGNNGSLDGGKRRVAAVTDSQGRAQAAFTLGTRAGEGNQRVEATAVGFQGPAVFTATALPGAPAAIVVDAGDQQIGVAGHALPRPLVAVVTDAGHNRLEGVAVRFSTVKGEGVFEGGAAGLAATTDSDGRAIAPFTLAPGEGIANNVVEAAIEALPAGAKASFVASGWSAGDPAQTAVSGVVLDNSNQPVPGVTLRILHTALTARADAKGVFRIDGAPVGTVKLVVDGSTAERPGSWPDLELVLTTVAGRNNTIGMPIFLLPLDLSSALVVDETRGGTLTLSELPGFALEVLPGSVTFPGGSRSGVISVTLVHGDKVPMVPNFGQQPRFIVTIQPAGARFEPPARLTMPNVEGLAPGEVTEMYSFDHDLGHFVSIGPGTVSDDGKVIVSDPGVGVLKAGWHCGGNPWPLGTAHQCPECYECVDSWCRSEPADDKRCRDDGDPCSIQEKCSGGRCLGTAVVVNKIENACVGAIGEPVQFKADSNAAHLLEWESQVGTPAQGSGGTHSVVYPVHGRFKVEAGCKTGPKTPAFVDIAPGCASFQPKPQTQEVPMPPIGNHFGTADALDFGVLFAACVNSGKWCARVSQFSARYRFGIDGGTNIDITGPNDPAVQPGTCKAIIDDLTPPPPGSDDGPPRNQYWSQAFTEQHERKHVQDLLKLVVQKTLDQLQQFVSDPQYCSECKREIERPVFLQKAHELWDANRADFDLVAETLAHDVSNLAYAALVESIKDRARNAPASENWPKDCQ